MAVSVGRGPRKGSAAKTTSESDDLVGEVGLPCASLLDDRRGRSGDEVLVGEASAGCGEPALGLDQIALEAIAFKTCGRVIGGSDADGRLDVATGHHHREVARGGRRFERLRGEFTSEWSGSREPLDRGSKRLEGGAEVGRHVDQRLQPVPGW